MKNSLILFSIAIHFIVLIEKFVNVLCEIKKPSLTNEGEFTRWWIGAELNCRHKDFQSFALPTELPIHWLRGMDLNHRPTGYEPGELPDCSTSRYLTGGGTGIRTQAPVSRPTGFQDRTLQPLGYSSNIQSGGPCRTRTYDQPVMSR